jgi:hypothetical protein
MPGDSGAFQEEDCSQGAVHRSGISIEMNIVRSCHVGQTATLRSEKLIPVEMDCILWRFAQPTFKKRCIIRQLLRDALFG